MDKPNTHRNLLEGFIKLRGGFDLSANLVVNLPILKSDPQVLLTKQDMVHALEMYLQESISSNQISAWARIIESRDDIGFSEIDDEILKRIIFNLSTPSINGEITKRVAKQWVNDLMST